MKSSLFLQNTRGGVSLAVFLPLATRLPRTVTGRGHPSLSIPLCFQALTNPSFRNPFLFTSIQNPGGVAPSALRNSAPSAPPCPEPRGERYLFLCPLRLDPIASRVARWAALVSKKWRRARGQARRGLPLLCSGDACASGETDASSFQRRIPSHPQGVWLASR
jgi:hypothetical protein